MKCAAMLLDFANTNKAGCGLASMYFLDSYPRANFKQAETFYVRDDIYLALSSLKVGSTLYVDIQKWPEQRGKNMVYVNHLMNVYPKDKVEKADKDGFVNIPDGI